MHLLHDKPVNGVIAVAGFIFLGIFLMFDFIDVDSRTNPQPTNLHTPPATPRPPPLEPPRPRPLPPTKEKSRQSSAPLPPTPTSRKPASCLKNTPPRLSIDLCFQGFAQELAASSAKCTAHLEAYSS